MRKDKGSLENVSSIVFQDRNYFQSMQNFWKYGVVKLLRNNNNKSKSHPCRSYEQAKCGEMLTVILHR